MFYDPIDLEVIDYVGGREDLAAGVVRTIGQPRQRFAEDYLRMLRAPRFAVRFGFRLDPATAEAIGEQAGRITSISGERIRDELTKMLERNSAAAAMALLSELGLARQILPELFADPDLWRRGLERLTRTAAACDATVNFAALLCELPAGTIRQITRKWGMSNRQREAIRFAAMHFDALPEAAGRMRLADLKRLLADARFDILRTIWQAREQAETGATALSDRLGERIASIDPDAIDPPPLLDGAELIEMGLPEGPRLGQVLQAVRDAQLQEQIYTQDQARALAAKMIDTPPEAR
jgi:tRNA nucleotidyltransferase/poly(A) polymerase